MDDGHWNHLTANDTNLLAVYYENRHEETILRIGKLSLPAAAVLIRAEPRWAMRPRFITRSLGASRRERSLRVGFDRPSQVDRSFRCVSQSQTFEQPVLANSHPSADYLELSALGLKLNI